jgi:hypothetical protein
MPPLEEPRPLNDDSDEAIREREHKQGIADDGKLDIVIELTIDGRTASRMFRLEDVAHQDWNPIVADMAEKLEEPDTL